MTPLLFSTSTQTLLPVSFSTLAFRKWTALQLNLNGVGRRRKWCFKGLYKYLYSHRLTLWMAYYSLIPHVASGLGPDTLLLYLPLIHSLCLSPSPPHTLSQESSSTVEASIFIALVCSYYLYVILSTVKCCIMIMNTWSHFKHEYGWIRNKIFIRHFFNEILLMNPVCYLVRS